MKFAAVLIVVFCAFLLVTDAKPKKAAVDDTVVPDVEETVPVKNVTKVDVSAVSEKIPALGKPEKDGENGDEKPDGEDEAITGFFESFFDCLYKAIEKWFPSDDDDDDDDASEESGDEDESKPTTRKAPATPKIAEEEEEEEVKKKK